MSTPEIILLSSDEEEEPPCKKIKPLTESPIKVEIIKVSSLISTDSEKDNEIEAPKSSPKRNESDECIDKENVQVEVQVQPSTSTNEPTELPMRQKLERFLVVCSESVQGSEYAAIVQKFPNVEKMYNQCGDKINKSRHFESMMQSNSKLASQSATCAFNAFYDIFKYLQNYAEKPDYVVVESEKALEKVKLLEKTIANVIKKITELDNQEVDLEDDNNSTYIKSSRYKDRLEQLTIKYKKLTKYDRLNDSKMEKFVFNHSEYPEINKAIRKTYKKYDQPFPNYDDIEKLISKTVTECNLPLTQDQQAMESVKILKKLGKQLQQQRKRNLYETHLNMIKSTEDPAKKNPELDKILKQNRIEGEKRINDLCEAFVNKTENEPESEFSDSDASQSGQESDED